MVRPFAPWERCAMRQRTTGERVRLLDLAAGVALAFLPAAAPRAQSGDAHELAKALSNPVADLVSVPFQFNWEEGVGYQDATRMVLNVQPVVPFTLNHDWNLIGRWIMPFVSQP